MSGVGDLGLAWKSAGELLLHCCVACNHVPVHVYMYTPCMIFATDLKTSIGLSKKKVALSAQIPPKVSGNPSPLPRRRARTVISSSDDEESPMHSSSLSKYRGDVYTAGDAMY